MRICWNDIGEEMMKDMFMAFVEVCLIFILSIGGIGCFIYLLHILFIALAPYAIQTKCVIEFADKSKVEAVSCDTWRNDTYLDCANGKRFSLYGVKSWECKR